MLFLVVGLFLLLTFVFPVLVLGDLVFWHYLLGTVNL